MPLIGAYVLGFGASTSVSERTRAELVYRKSSTCISFYGSSCVLVTIFEEPRVESATGTRLGQDKNVLDIDPIIFSIQKFKSGKVNWFLESSRVYLSMERYHF